MKPLPLKPLCVAGIMSGTSADGIDVAIVRIGPRIGPRSQTGPARLAVELLAHHASAFPAALRTAILAAQDAPAISTAELARLNWRLGLAYAKAFTAAASLHGEGAEDTDRINLIGCHGQTIYHQAKPARYTGETFACTWQIGEMALLASASGLPVLSNFRPADMVAGGQGAPLVPLLDEAIYRDARRTRILQNIGGIGNLTVVPPASSASPVMAFDTGPGNMVVDALMQQLFHKPYDRGGKVAAKGRVLLPVIARILQQPFFAQKPPRSAGREQFGAAFTASLLRECKLHKASEQDAVATATALTAHAIAQACEQFVPAALRSGGLDLIVSGGGAKNLFLLQQLEALLAPRGMRVLLSSDASLPTPMPVEAKEAAAFALLAYLSWHHRPANVPSATGARHAVVLGQVTCA